MPFVSEPPREWRFYVQDMVRFCERVLAYTSGMTQAEFIASGLNYDATLRNLELIGEAATHLHDAVRDQNPTIPWRQIIATRNRLIHGYLGIDDDTLWSIIDSDVPVLLGNLQRLVDDSKPDEKITPIDT